MSRVIPFAPPAARALAAEALGAETAGLIADFGQPQWPFWRWLMALLLLAQLAVLAQQAGGAEIEQLRTRPGARRPTVERVQRAGRAGRTGGPNQSTRAARRADS